MSGLQKPMVLVTGGAGYIGSHVVLALLDTGFPVVVLDNLATGFEWAVDPRAVLVVGSVGDAPTVRELLARHEVKAILHFAGSIIVPESVTDPLKYYRNNTDASRTLLECAVAAEVPHFLFSSSAAVYGVAERIPITEDCPTQAITPYGRSKLMTEWMLQDIAAAHPLSYCILRYFNVAGADPAGRAGQSSRIATHLIKVAVEAARGKRGHVAIFGNDFETPDGTGVRDYVHVTDLAAAHLAALEKLLHAPGTRSVYNCGYGHGYSVLEVLDAADRVCGRPIPRILQERRVGDPPELVAQSKKIGRELGWTPRFDNLEQIIGDALAWERKLEERSCRSGGST